MIYKKINSDITDRKYFPEIFAPGLPTIVCKILYFGFAIFLTVFAGWAILSTQMLIPIYKVRPAVTWQSVSFLDMKKFTEVPLFTNHGDALSCSLILKLIHESHCQLLVSCLEPCMTSFVTTDLSLGMQLNLPKGLSDPK